MIAEIQSFNQEVSGSIPDALTNQINGWTDIRFSTRRQLGRTGARWRASPSLQELTLE
ncbi:hypothetical protein [Methylovirgula ligni]|uniref:hypothetical protein n=1 Tax=Methylovirgula ligni TaxID=569860 RepID=UPI0015F28CEA|nr:hypothetical protein [Methylovirgula ligni]